MVPGEYPQYDATLGITVEGEPLCKKYCNEPTIPCGYPVTSCDGASIRGTIQLSVGVEQQYQKAFRGVVSSPNTIEVNKRLPIGMGKTSAPFQRAFQLSNFKSALSSIIKKLPKQTNKEESTR